MLSNNSIEEYSLDFVSMLDTTINNFARTFNDISSVTIEKVILSSLPLIVVLGVIVFSLLMLIVTHNLDERDRKKIQKQNSFDKFIFFSLFFILV